MVATVEQVVTRLQAAIKSFDGAAVAVRNLQDEARRAQQMIAHAGEGSVRAEASQCADDLDTAAAKLGKVARLLANAAEKLAEYAAIIAPAATPNRGPTSEAMPTGEQLVAKATGEGELTSMLLGRAGTVKNNDDGFQYMKKIGDNLHKAVRPDVVAPSPKGPVIKSESPAAGGAGDALLAVMVLALVGRKTAEWIKARRNVARKLKRDNSRLEGNNDG